MAVEITYRKRLGSTIRSINCRGRDCPLGYCVAHTLREVQQLLDCPTGIASKSGPCSRTRRGAKVHNIGGILSESKRFPLLNAAISKYPEIYSETCGRRVLGKKSVRRVRRRRLGRWFGPGAGPECGLVNPSLYSATGGTNSAER